MMGGEASAIYPVRPLRGIAVVSQNQKLKSSPQNNPLLHCVPASVTTVCTRQHAALYNQFPTFWLRICVCRCQLPRHNPHAHAQQPTPFHSLHYGRRFTMYQGTRPLDMHAYAELRDRNTMRRPLHQRFHPSAGHILRHGERHALPPQQPLHADYD